LVGSRPRDPDFVGRGFLVALATTLTLIASPARADDLPDLPPATSAEPKADPAPRAEPAATTPSTPIATSPSPASDTPTCDDESKADCKCTTHCCRWRRGKRGSCMEPSLDLSVVGIRPSLTRVSVAGQASSDVGLGFAGKMDSYALNGTTHSSMQFALGGGQAGFEGMLAGVIDFGYRLDVSEKQGPFGRIGFDGRIQGNDAFYFSALELPRMTLGWQFLSGRTVLEIGARGGPILTGRFNPGDGVRSTTGAWEYGGFASAQVEFLRFEGTAIRIDARKTGNHAPVDVGRGALCAVTAGSARGLGICADFMVIRGDANVRSAGGFTEALATYAGVTVGGASW
jgi:hypothetical protein